VSTATRAIDLGTLRRFDRPGPRYTSYPTAVEFDESVEAETYRRHLAEVDRADPDSPVSLYAHIPFCRKRCSFCACHVIATRHEEVAEPYLNALEREMRAVAGELPRRRRVAQMHWGGGTPIYLSPAQIEALAGAVRRLFTFEAGAEIAIEVDPRVTTRGAVFTSLDRLTLLSSCLIAAHLSIGDCQPPPASRDRVGSKGERTGQHGAISVAELGVERGVLLKQRLSVGEVLEALGPPA
jgi:hypothetical protein